MHNRGRRSDEHVSQQERVYLLERLEEDCALAHDRVTHHFEAMKTVHDAHLQQRIEYQPNQLVLLYDNWYTQFSGKLHMH